jgi:hypothetical protein
MRNLYKNAMIALIKNTHGQIVTGAQLVKTYKEVAAANGQTISQSHVPLNVHKFAKKNGICLGQFKNCNGRKTSIYVFNF